MFTIDLFLNWLSLIAGYLLPLFTLPVISRQLSLINQGEYFVWLALCSIGITLCEFGFNISTTRRIAVNIESESEQKKAIIFTILTKVIIFLLFALVILITNRKLEFELIVISFAYIFFHSFYPTWFFLGRSISRFNAIYMTSGKFLSILFLIIYFYFVEISTVEMICLIITLGGFFSFALSWIHLLRLINPFPKKLNWNIIPSDFKEDLGISLGAVLISSFTSLPPIALANFSGLEEVSLFSTIEKVYKSIEYVITTFLIVNFSKIAQGFLKKPKSTYFKILKVEKYILIIGFLIFFFSLIFGKTFLIFIFGKKLQPDLFIVAIMSLIPLLGALCVLWGNVALVSINARNKLTKIVASSSSIVAILLIPFCKFFGAHGAAVILLLAGFMISIRSRYAFFKLFFK